MSSTFTIDADNNITAYASAEEANQGKAEGLIHFDSQATLAKVSADWPISRFIEIWNGIPGQMPLKKFQDRKKAVARVWAAIQPLAVTAQPMEAAAAKAEPPRKGGKQDKKAKTAKTAKKATVKPSSDKASERSNKKAVVIAMMARAKGATLAEIMEATGWQKHTVRGFVSILGSKRAEHRVFQECRRGPHLQDRQIARLLSGQSRRSGFSRGGVPAFEGWRAKPFRACDVLNRA